MLDYFFPQSPGTVRQSMITEISALSPVLAYFLVEVLIDSLPKDFPNLLNIQ